MCVSNDTYACLCLDANLSRRWSKCLANHLDSIYTQLWTSKKFWTVIHVCYGVFDPIYNWHLDPNAAWMFLMPIRKHGRLTSMSSISYPGRKSIQWILIDSRCLGQVDYALEVAMGCLGAYDEVFHQIHNEGSFCIRFRTDSRNASIQIQCVTQSIRIAIMKSMNIKLKSTKKYNRTRWAYLFSRAHVSRRTRKHSTNITHATDWTNDGEGWKKKGDRRSRQ